MAKCKLLSFSHLSAEHDHSTQKRHVKFSAVRNVNLAYAYESRRRSGMCTLSYKQKDGSEVQFGPPRLA